MSGGGKLEGKSAAAGTELEIDEDENPSEGSTKKIAIETVSFEFAKPFETTSKGRKGATTRKAEEDEGDLPPEDESYLLQ